MTGSTTAVSPTLQSRHLPAQRPAGFQIVYHATVQYALKRSLIVAAVVLCAAGGVIREGIGRNQALRRMTSIGSSSSSTAIRCISQRE